jgi:hypothetical protein
MNLSGFVCFYVDSTRPQIAGMLLSGTIQGSVFLSVCKNKNKTSFLYTMYDKNHPIVRRN